jgi:hypothetical protein
VIAHFGGIKKSSFSEALNTIGLEQLLELVQALKRQGKRLTGNQVLSKKPTLARYAPKILSLIFKF